MPGNQCRNCGHKVELFEKKCHVCGSIYPGIREDVVIVFLIVTVIIISLGIYIFIYFS